MAQASIVFALAASFVLACTVANAEQPEQTPGSHILVTDCYPHGHAKGSGGHPWIDPYGVMHPAEHFPYGEGFLAIAYANTAKKTAKEVDFGLVAHATLVAVANDVGTFPEGKQIKHEFTISPEIFPVRTETPYCAVLRVKYVDGTEWRIPFPPQERGVAMP